jgi:GDP-4-dehydro-6-deoxy-D-mannose reductase
MRAIVTGASGFVGDYLVARLVSEGAEVLGLDSRIPDGNKGRGRYEINGRILPPPFPEERAEIISCDLLDADAVGKAVSNWKPDLIFHLAAQSSAARSFEDPGGTMLTNVVGTLNLLEAVRRVKDTRIVVAGSAEEYGRRAAEEMPVRETAPIEPVSPYAASKAAQNTLVMQYHRAFGVEVMATRSFSHTGPGQTTNFVLPAFARQCAEIKAGLRDPLLRTGNLEVTRDFLDVRDVVEAYLSIAADGIPGTTYNVCSGIGLELSDALDLLIGMTEIEIDVATDPELLRPADVPILIGDNGRLENDCSWSASIETSRMLSDLYKWWEMSVSFSHEGKVRQGSDDQ